MGLVSSFMTNWSQKKYKYVFSIDGADVYVARGRTLRQWQNRSPDVLAFAFGNTIVVQGKENLTPEVLDHERTHIEQARRMGGELVFRPALLLSSAWAWVTRGDAYDNRFEREALAAERR